MPEYTTGHSPAERQAREERRANVAVLIASGVSQRRIAAQLGVGLGTVNGDVQAVRQEWRRRATGSYETYVAEAMAKLDLLESRVMPHALRLDDNGRVNLWAVDRALAIIDRRCVLLGLDKPVKPAPLHIELQAQVKHEHGVDTRSLAGALAALEQMGVVSPPAVTVGTGGNGQGTDATHDGVHVPDSNGQAADLPLPE